MTKMRVDIDDDLLREVRQLMRADETLSQWIEEGARSLIARKKRELAERESQEYPTKKPDSLDT